MSTLKIFDEYHKAEAGWDALIRVQTEIIRLQGIELAGHQTEKRIYEAHLAESAIAAAEIEADRLRGEWRHEQANVWAPEFQAKRTVFVDERRELCLQIDEKILGALNAAWKLTKKRNELSAEIKEFTRELGVLDKSRWPGDPDELSWRWVIQGGDWPSRLVNTFKEICKHFVEKVGQGDALGFQDYRSK